MNLLPSFLVKEFLKSAVGKITGKCTVAALLTHTPYGLRAVMERIVTLLNLYALYKKLMYVCMYVCNAPDSFVDFSAINCLLTYFTFLILTCLLPLKYAHSISRLEIVTNRQPNLALLFKVYFVLWYILLRMHVFICCVRLSFSVLSQEIGWKERLRNDLFCIGWDVI